MNYSLIIALLMSMNVIAQKKTQEELREEVIDYSNIQKLLKKDGLEKNAKLKKKIVQQIKVEKQKIKVEKFNYPSNEDFWGFASRMWLVKNAQELKWDVPRPDYGIRERFRKLLEEFGYYNENFKILIVDSPNIVKLALPSAKNESIYVLSLPFMRALDLSKTEISLLLLEDFFRLKSDMFKSNLGVDTSIIGANFANAEFNKSALLKILKAYGDVAYKKGFSFQQQYEITKKMDKVLKSSPEAWNSYFKLLKKIDQLVKNNLMYKNYLKIYPSPELQIEWLSPKKKVL